MQVSLHFALPEGAAGAEPPAWLHLLPMGSFRGVDGRGPFKLVDASVVIANSMGGGAIPVDENHATDFAIKTGQPSPARGWVREMQSRPDGIWGRVEWCPTGVQLMNERAYRGISPVIVTEEKTGAVTRVLRVALTNTPNLDSIRTLHSEQENDMDIAKLRKALGLPEAATEAEVLAAVEGNVTSVTAHSAQLTRIAAAAGVTGTPDAEALVTVLNTQREAVGGTHTMAQQLVSMQTELATARNERARDAATVFVDGAIQAGKPILVLRDHFITRHMADPAAVKTEIDALPSIHALGMTAEQVASLHAAGGGGGGGGDDTMSAADNAVCKKMGISKEKFIAQRKKKRAAEMED